MSLSQLVYYVVAVHIASSRLASFVAAALTSSSQLAYSPVAAQLASCVVAAHVDLPAAQAKRTLLAALISPALCRICCQGQTAAGAAWRRERRGGPLSPAVAFTR